MKNLTCLCQNTDLIKADGNLWCIKCELPFVENNAPYRTVIPEKNGYVDLVLRMNANGFSQPDIIRHKKTWKTLWL